MLSSPAGRDRGCGSRPPWPPNRRRGGEEGIGGALAPRLLLDRPPPQTGSPPADGQPSVLTPSPDPAGTCLGVPTLSPPPPTVNRGTGSKRPEAPEGPGRQAPRRRRGRPRRVLPSAAPAFPQPPAANSSQLPPGQPRSPSAGGLPARWGLRLTPDAGRGAGSRPSHPSSQEQSCSEPPRGADRARLPTATRGLFPPLYAAPRGLPQRKAGTGTPVAGSSCRGTQLGTQTPVAAPPHPEQCCRTTRHEATPRTPALARFLARSRRPLPRRETPQRAFTARSAPRFPPSPSGAFPLLGRLPPCPVRTHQQDPVRPPSRGPSLLHSCSSLDPSPRT